MAFAAVEESKERGDGEVISQAFLQRVSLRIVDMETYIETEATREEVLKFTAS